MRTPALVLGIGLTLILAGCTNTPDGTATTTSITAATTTSTRAATTTSISSDLPVVDPSWSCHYLSDVVAIQAPEGEVDGAVEIAVGMLQPVDPTAGPTTAEAVLGEEDAPPDRAANSDLIGEVLGLVSTSMDPMQASLYLEEQGIEEQGIATSPIHAVGLAGHWHFSPGTDPVPMPNSTLPTVANGTGAYVAVVDSGFVPGGPAWVDGDNVAFDTFDIDDDPGLASHGTFITGLIRQLSPDNRVSIARAPFVAPDSFITRGGDEEPPQVALSSELHVFEAVERLITRHREAPGDVEALNMSLGTYTCDPGDDPLLVTLVAALQRWDTEIGAVSFAAGGNEVYPEPFWPGALDTVRAVGAANQGGAQIVWAGNDEELANPRDWIDDVAPGGNLVGLATPGNNAGTELVAWSGSSFATAVAAALYARGETPTLVDRVNWWLQNPVDYDAVSGLSYTTDPLTQPVKTVP